jgi:Ca2+-transporting ATPase
MSLIPVLFNMPHILLPVHIVFLELIIDPACSIVFESEKEEATVMNRPPSRKEEGLFTRKNRVLSLLRGFVVLALDLVVYISSLDRGLDEAEARTLTFTAIVIANLCLILTNRSWSGIIPDTLRVPNRALVWVFTGTQSCLFLVLYIPALRDLFRFAPVPFIDILMCAVAGVLSIVWFELYKCWFPGKEVRGSSA